MEEFPRYHEHPAHTEDYHEAFSAVIRAVEAEAADCKRCHQRIHQKVGHRRTYCPPCAAAVQRERDRERWQRGASA